MMGFRNLRRSLGAGVVAVFIGCTFSAGADAASYDVYSCRGPVGQPLSSAAWQPKLNDAEPGDLTITDTCLSGGAVTLETNPAGINGPRKARLDYVFDLPAGATISSFQLNRSIRASATEGGLNYNYRAGVRQSAGGTYTDTGCGSVFVPGFSCSSVGSPTDPADPSNVFDVPAANLTGLGTFASCESVGCDLPQYQPGAEFKLYGSRVTIEDNDPPAIEQIGGSLASGQPISGRTDLYVSASDQNAGVRSISMTIDGAAYATNPSASAKCVIPYQVAQPCPTEAGRIFPVDVTSLSVGDHVAAGQVVDAAGNTTPFGPVNFTVKPEGSTPGPQVPNNGNPAMNDPRLSLDSDLVEHDADEPARISGSLTTANGAPVAGAILAVTTTDLGSTTLQEESAPPVTTGPDGKFTFSLEGAGARKILVSYTPVIGGAVTRTASTTARSRISLGLKVRKRVTKRDLVTFRGKLSGAGSAARGANIEIQAISRGKWRTVATETASGNGDFKWKYRFRFVTSDAVFTFRSLIRRTPGWPWPSEASRPVKVRIDVG